jgi:uncharacterized protein YdhG (YjbR/CyaY superfamily)
MNTVKGVDEYIGKFGSNTQTILGKIREIVLASHPEIIESIAYMMPAYKLNKKPLVYFAAYEKHIGFYATPTGHEAFKAALAPYKQGKGSVQFPLAEDMPYELIKEITQFRVRENLGVK